MASVTRTLSPTLLAMNNSASRRISVADRRKSDNVKHSTSVSPTLQTSRTVKTQRETVCDQIASEHKSCPSILGSVQCGPLSTSATDVSGIVSSSSTVNFISVSATTGHSPVQLKALESTDDHTAIRCPPLHGHDPSLTVHRADVPSGSIGSTDAAQTHSITASASRWAITVEYEASCMESLGKNRYLAHYLAVPSEADARFAQIKDNLEADVRGSLTGVRSSNPIIFSDRLRMIGSKTGTTIVAEPTILISCGSWKGKCKIKSDLQRIRPHYLQSLDMKWIVRHDSSAPVLAGYLAASDDDYDYDDDDGCDQRSAGPIHIQQDDSSTSCGLKLMIESRSSSTKNRAYATLGGIIKLGESYYGVTAAHPLVNVWSAASDTQVDDDSGTLSDVEDFSDSSDEDEEEESVKASSIRISGKLKGLPTETDDPQMHQGIDFVKLASERSMAYSFNGECYTSSASVSVDMTTSDWAIVEVPEAYIRPNSYVEAHVTSEGEPAPRIVLKSVMSSSHMKSGRVCVLSNADIPHIGHLSMNSTSLQFDRGTIDVCEVLLETPISNGMSGSWVVRGDQVVGMVIALSNKGLSCYIVPMWRVFESIELTCKTEAKLHRPVSAESRADWKASKQPFEIDSQGSKNLRTLGDDGTRHHGMRLLNTRTFELEQFDDNHMPPYAILSHRWQDDEVLFRDIETGQARSRSGFQKLESFCGFARQQRFAYVWVDTCCINKSSSVELTEAINSMYRWYKNAAVCYAFLHDIHDEGFDKTATITFTNSVWFTRGWTLQELIAPSEVLFFNAFWQLLGTKSNLSHTLSRATSIDEKALTGKMPLSVWPICQRMAWAARRATTLIEDQAYSLLGIFSVNMPISYGEGEMAFQRLEREITKRHNDHSLLAWHDGSYEKPIPAPSLLCFKGQNHFVPMRTTNVQLSEGYNLTNTGLVISLDLIPWVMNTYLVPWNCTCRDPASHGGQCPSQRRNEQVAFFCSGLVATTNSHVFTRWQRFDEDASERYRKPTPKSWHT